MCGMDETGVWLRKRKRAEIVHVALRRFGELSVEAGEYPSMLAFARAMRKRAQARAQAGRLKEGFSYRDYLLSPEWNAKRLDAITRAGYRCQLCGTQGLAFDVHHNTYNHIGCEEPEDLICLCQLCHEKHHGKKDLA